MALDLDELLAPVSEDEPSGPDLAYDNERIEIEQVFDTEVSVDASGLPANAVEVDWRRVLDKIGDQGRRTKDVWLACYMCRAGALSGSLETVELGARYLAGLLEGFWPSLHPQLEEFGFQGRKSACDSLSANTQFIYPLRRIVLLRHPRLGAYTSADFERFRLGADAEDGYGLFRAALDDVGDAGLREILARLKVIVDSLKRADAVLTANADGGGAPNFRPTYETLAEIQRAVQFFLSEPPADATPPPSGGEARAAAAPAGQAGAAPGRIETREDVIRALDALTDYYRRREPAHPAPILFQRAREWVTLDFMEILADIAPGGVDEARLVLQSRRQRDG